MKTELFYPMMLGVSNITDCPFWKPLFLGLAHGRAPTGCYVSNSGFLTCGIKNKEFAYKLDADKPVEELRRDITRLLKERLKLLSFDDRIKRLKKFEDAKRIQKEKMLECGWADIRKKNIKDMLLENYVIDLMRKKKLGKQHAVKLFAKLTIAIIFKLLSPCEILCKNGKIDEITGVSSEGEIEVIAAMRLNETPRKVTTRNKKVRKMTTRMLWDKFI
jgi:hypothetical protein